MRRTSLRFLWTEFNLRNRSIFLNIRWTWFRLHWGCHFQNRLGGRFKFWAFLWWFLTWWRFLGWLLRFLIKIRLSLVQIKLFDFLCFIETLWSSLLEEGAHLPRIESFEIVVFDGSFLFVDFLGTCDVHTVSIGGDICSRGLVDLIDFGNTHRVHHGITKVGRNPRLIDI